MKVMSKIKQNLRVYTKKNAQIGQRVSSMFLTSLLIIFTFLTSSIQGQINKNFKVKTLVIDAGHGGHDPGCLGSTVQEKAVCLGVALKLGKLVEDYFKDVKVIYTRDSDVFVKLMDRAKIANKNKADLFISIHANSAQNKSAFGTETFVMGTKYTDRNLELTKRENSVILLEKDYEKNYNGYDPNSPMANILMGLYQQEYLESSINFASKIEHQFQSRNKRKSRGVRQRVLLVMYRTTMPSVLVETGFLTNKADHSLLKDAAGQAETAGAIFRAFLEYKREMEGATSSEISKEEALVFLKWDSTLTRVLSLKMDAGSTAKLEAQIKADKDSVQKSIATKTAVEIENTKEKAKAINHDLIFRVQITSSSKKIPLNSRKFNGLNDIFEYKFSATFKYAVGNCITQNEAVDLQKKVKSSGFEDAFVIAFFNGERVSMKKAREIIKKGKN
jgi:N-acetylmuramoyl-L-alanine amidase